MFMNTNTKILVTGASGFLGKHLVNRLNKLGCEVYTSNTKIGNLNNLQNLTCFSGVKFDYIFHLAVVTRGGDYCLTHQATQWIENQTINTNMLKYWVETQPQAKMICMGTSCSYSPDIYMTEDNYLIGIPETSLYSYAMTKRMLLNGLQSIEQQYGLKWLYFIPSTLYGPGFQLDDNHFIFDFIRNCYNAKYHNQDFIVWGDGEQRRELIYVSDAIDAMLNLLDNENQVFNLGSGDDNSINEFAKIVSDCYGYDHTLIKHDMNKYIGVKQKKIDTRKVLKFLNNQSYLKTDLKTGIEICVKDFIKRTQNIDKL
jgi:GDP-L-fucose synthase